ncbi:MAG: class II D-tagatose-bisphosphate aldolase, non-catalytic subunit [Actinobacteria bacterium]|nr:class II D-tagatose-bisphosphate aldolase, non-catalytic subunit [Actinomycetota bacterium]
MNKVINYFNKLISLNNSQSPKGVYSICSINKYVLESALLNSKSEDDYIIIESTCNQVNQFGGYSNMTPEKFREYLFSIAQEMGFPKERLIIGGDHIGPFPFRHEDSSIAMKKAHNLLKSCIQAEYSKIHIDTSIALKGDRVNEDGQIDKELIAKRLVDLVKTSESTLFKIGTNNNKILPVYVIGTDIPAPGGSGEVREGRRVTSVSDFKETMEVTKELFYKNKLFDAWERVVAVVVQPGVEHGDHIVIDYSSEAAENLIRALDDYPNIVFEAHATDYQTASNLKKMVSDKFKILKLGPILTYVLREAVFMLNLIEKELFSLNSDKKLSRFIDVLDRGMLEDPKHWVSYYSGSENDMRLSRKYSFFDRSRYYWNNKKVGKAFELLLKNLKDVDIPLTLTSQFLPLQYEKVRNGVLAPDPLSLIRDKIISVIDKYSFAIGKKFKR